MKSKATKIRDENGVITRVMVDEKGAVTSIDTYSTTDQVQYFAAIMRCGHCSKSVNYMPILFPILAANKKEALTHALHFPKVKSSDGGNSGHCVALFQITRQESIVLRHINNNDIYLTAPKIDYQAYQDREVILPYRVRHSKFGKTYDVNGETYKTADKYDESDVLQRMLAPVLVGNQIIVERKLPKKDILLYEYIGQYLKHAPFDKTTLRDFFTYYKMFGHIKPHLFEIEEKNGNLICTRNGITERLPIPKNVLNSVYFYDYDIYKKDTQKEDIMQTIEQISSEDYEKAMAERRKKVADRFATYDRSLISRNKQKEAQPGDE